MDKGLHLECAYSLVKNSAMTMGYRLFIQLERPFALMRSLKDLIYSENKLCSSNSETIGTF